jgi:TPP-dependent 2-oxoacid decarboxylase
MSAQGTVGTYLLARLKELHIDTVFGVPGDYMLDFIEMVCDDRDVRWVGNCNELNAGYVADGYARVRGAAALVVTGGVGDLGAIGAVGGAYAENVPLIVVSGTPGPKLGPSGRPMVHHSLGDGSFAAFRRMYAEITTATATLAADTAAEQIDELCRRAWIDRKPVFVVIPEDVATVPLAPPRQPLDLDSPRCPEDQLAGFAAELHRLLAAAKAPVILVDAGARQFRRAEALQDVLDSTGVPWATTRGARWDLDSTRATYLGVYFGSAQQNPAVGRIDDADVVIRIGAQIDEFAIGKAHPAYTGPELVDVGPHASSVGGRHFASLDMASALTILERQLSAVFAAPAPSKAARRSPTPLSPNAVTGRALTQDFLWAKLGSYFAAGDTIAIDTGTCSAGLRSIDLPAGVTVLHQNVWASIGWSLPALLGAQYARAGRHVLLIGDGAFALTVQEISTMLTAKHAPLLVVLNNGGYLIEDVAAGRKMTCNDLWRWRYSALPSAFDGQDEFEPLGLRVETEDELGAALTESTRAQADGRLVLLEAVLGRDDLPRIMRR